MLNGETIKYLAIASEYKNNGKLSFNFVSKEYVLTEKKVMNVSKVIQESDIPLIIIKKNENLFAEAIWFCFNKSLENNEITIEKLTIIILPVFSKIFDRLLSRQLLEFLDDMLSKFQCGFRKGYGTEHCLLLMLEIWKGATNNNKVSGALITDFSKAFDCLSHDLFIDKLHAK